MRWGFLEAVANNRGDCNEVIQDGLYCLATMAFLEIESPSLEFGAVASNA